MNNAVRRFLAVNCILNGHSLISAFDNNAALAAEALGSVPEAQVWKWDRDLRNLEKTGLGMESFSPVTRVVLKYFRMKEYAFITIPGSGPIYFDSVVESDKNGELEPDVLSGVLSLVVRDIAYVKSASDVRFADGVLYIPTGMEAQVRNDIVNAYRLYAYGPNDTSRLVDILRGHSSLTQYSAVSVRTFREIIDALLSYKVKPSVYGKTSLLIEDLLSVYQTTGCVFTQAVGDSENVLWLLDNIAQSTAKLVTVPIELMRTLIIESISDLAAVSYRAGGPNNGLVIGG